MSIKSKVLAAAAALTLGADRQGWPPPPGRQPRAAGRRASTMFNQIRHVPAPEFRPGHPAAGHESRSAADPVPRSNSDPAKDYTVSYQGQVRDFCSAGLVSAAVNLHYGCCNGNVQHRASARSARSVSRVCGRLRVRDPVRALRRGKRPVRRGSLAAGLRGEGQPPAVRGQRGYGLDHGPLWTRASLNPVVSEYVPLIDGTDTNFSLPFVLTYSASGYPTDVPRPQLFVSNLTGFSQTGGTGRSACRFRPGAGQQPVWGADLGVLP